MDDGAKRSRRDDRATCTGTCAAPAADRPRVQPHHRRRRAMLALALVAVVALDRGHCRRRRTGGARFTTAQARRAATSGGSGRSPVAGPGSFSATEQAAQNAAINRTLSYTPFVRIAGSQHRELALTFDDGPGPYTPAILAVLDRENVPATFFEVGVLETYFHASTAAIVAHGDSIGDHTESHPPMGELPPKSPADAAPPGRLGDRRRTARRSRACSVLRTGRGTRPRCGCCTSTGC